MTTGFRTLFLARQPTWEGWLDALGKNWVVAVRHDAVSGGKSWLHGGDAEVVAFVTSRERQWRWWDNAEIRRPMVAIVAVKPDDEFESGRPEQGVALRVRCAWENTTQGLPRKPIAELVTLAVDGVDVQPELRVEKTTKNAAVADHAHRFHLARPAPGRHTATVVVRVLATGENVSRTIAFDV
jgi:hypothetical protein